MLDEDYNDPNVNDDEEADSLFRSPVYFTATRFHFKLLRLFNLMEPDRNVISISKMMVWATLGLLAYTSIYHYDDLTAMLPVLGVFFTTVGHYGFRRVMNDKKRSKNSEDPGTDE